MTQNVHTISIEQPTNLADHLRSLRMPVRMSCGGHGSCTTCRVLVDGEPVLSCQQQMEPGEYKLEMPLAAIQSSEMQIDLSTLGDCFSTRSSRWHGVKVCVPRAEEQPQLSNAQRLQEALKAQNLRLSATFWHGQSSVDFQGNLELACFDDQVYFPALQNAADQYAVAVDIGTTTIVCALVRLQDSKVLSCRGRINAQYAYAEDLVARISFCTSRERLEEMQNLVLRQTLVPLIWNLLKQENVAAEQVMTTVLSGNATMIHLLLGYDPTSMGGWPFNGVDYAPATRSAAELKLPGRHVEFMPAQSAYYGGDVLSGLQWLDFENCPDGSLFADLGTNAELALKAGDQLYCTAVPAGPAFEGGGLACGIGAVPGAVDYVWEEEKELKFSTIGKKPPLGFCGSGVVSFVAAALRARVLDKKGHFTADHPNVVQTDILGKTQQIFQLAEDVYLSEEDISAFLQAKAAVFSGIATLCRVAGRDAFDIAHLYLAGNFGSYLKFRDMIDIGMVQPLSVEQVTVCGNTSLKGAINGCVDRTATGRLEKLIKKLRFVDLNTQKTFQDDFINALFLPHLNLEFTYPSVRRN